MNQLLHQELTYEIRRALFSVYNNLGFGHKEQVYVHALKREFSLLGIPFENEVRLPVLYKLEKVGYYQPDFVIDKKIVIEIKAVPIMPAYFEKQLINYLKGVHYQLGLLVNFGGPRLTIKRIIWTG